MSCMILGDSIAQGVASHRPDCLTIAERGIGSPAWAARHFPIPGGPRDLVIISLGANDLGFDDREDLERVRAAITAPHVIWIVPSNSAVARRNVLELAAAHGDRTIDVRARPMANTVHPTDTSYGVMAREAR